MGSSGSSCGSSASSDVESRDSTERAIADPNRTSFTTSLLINVEGATQIYPNDNKKPVPLQKSTKSQQAPSTGTQRAPRKSKTDALAALHTHARSASIGPEDSGYHDTENNIFVNRPPIPVAPHLDMSSVKTSSPRTLPPRNYSRPFDLDDCPTFYPTAEEFKDAAAYIRSISDRAINFGICKIVPPDGWKMPFVTDTETFRFKTRLQQLNSIEASSRAKVNFLEQLYRFHKQQGNPRVSAPTINHKQLDLWLLRKEVHKLGGYDAVTRNRKWSDLGRILGYTGIPGLSTQLKNSYTRVILPYEHFCERVKNSPSMSPLTRDPQTNHSNGSSPGKHSQLNSTATVADDTSPPSSPLTATSSLLSEPPDEAEYRGISRNRSSSSKPRKNARMGSQGQATSRRMGPSTSQTTPSTFHDNSDVKQSSEVRTRFDLEEAPSMQGQQENCELCHKKNRGQEMLLCDGCDCGFHIFCLDPPLTSVPKGKWFCHTCLFGTGGDFGFDEGEEHSLASFQARDLAFRRFWFKSHGPFSVRYHDRDDVTVNWFDDLSVSEDEVENEFWRLVQSQNETVEIEYGADVHSTTHGSAMPTMETHPLDPYSKDLWNLNNIPIISDSLLRFIKSDISGMTVPWTYVGMVFSTFCWHNEDHFTYSINFMHWGETKTWYGIPGEDAEKFEAAIKCEAPDLFEAQPDLLFQLVTLMNPKRVKDAGVRVYACNQRAGEFVITFPKAYHAGFNHGLNFNEAVNFALPDWLPYGRDCVQRYREHGKSPVFSHDELLITITQQSQTVKTALWLIDSLKEMTARELNDRKRARASGLSETLEEEDLPEEQYQCTVCKSFCYLSQVTCQCPDKVVCVDHIDLLCDRTGHHLNLRKRISDEDLLEIEAKVAERAGVPTTWRGKLTKMLLESARPQLRSLRAILAEGERVNHNLPELASLRKCVNRANEWIEAANTFIIRKQSRKRSRKSRGRPPLNEPATSVLDDPDRPDRGLDDLYVLLREVENMGFDTPEIGVLRLLAQQAEEVKVKARALLELADSEYDRDAYVQDCERLLLEGSSLNVYLDELSEIEKIVMREQLIKELEEKLDDSTMTLPEVRQLVERANACNLGSANKQVELLLEKQQTGEEWEERAKNVLAKPQKTIDELERYSDVDPSIPVDPTILARLTAALSKAMEYRRQARAWLDPGFEGPRPKVQDVMRLITRAEKDFLIPEINQLDIDTDSALDIETKCESALKLRYWYTPSGPNDNRDAFDNMRSWCSFAEQWLKLFSLPALEKLDQQLIDHDRWLKSLPWYCREHREAHGQQILDDVMESTRPDDDLPPSDEYFTCICTTPVRPPPPGTVSDAVQCDHCYARFHGICAANGGSCPFCDHHHWNGAIHKERGWHFSFLPTILLSASDITRRYSKEWKQLEIIVHRIDRLSAVIGQFLSFASQPGNQRLEYIPQVRHYMRKLYKIQFAVSPNREVSFGLDLAGLHRILASQPAPVRMKKRRRPRFTFGQDTDKDWMDGTRCICRGHAMYLLNTRTVECEVCARVYHMGCVFFPPESAPSETNRFMCPLCCLRKNRIYAYSEMRVKPIEGTDHEPDDYVDTRTMLDTFSKEIIYMKMRTLVMPTIFVELVRFTPGQPDNVTVNRSSSRTAAASAAHQQTVASDSSHSHSAPTPAPSSSLTSTFDVSGNGSVSDHHAPSPWSRWGTVSTPSTPPSTQRRQPADASRGTPQPSKKRKYIEDIRHSEDTASTSSSTRSLKRRVTQPSPLPSGPSSRPVQTLSPSLAMIVSPPETETSPRLSSSKPFSSSSIAATSESTSFTRAR